MFLSLADNYIETKSGKMWICVVLSLAVLLPFASAQVGSCPTDDEAMAYSNEQECRNATTDITFLQSQIISDDELNSALEIFCTPDCGEKFVKYAIQTCGDVLTGLASLISCVPREVGPDRCRNASADRIDPVIAQDLQSCVSFDGTECPANCSAALTAAVDAIGCCYQILYNDTDIVNFLVLMGLLDASTNMTLAALRYPALWNSCGVSIPGFCTGDPFPGETTLPFGICSQDTLNAYVGTLEATCATSYATAYSPTSTDEARNKAFESVCQKDCGGKVAAYLDDTCVDPFLAYFTVLSCDPSDGDLGDRCANSLNPDPAPLFTTASVECSAPTQGCAADCAAALTAIASQMGCCYQSIYNNPIALDLLLINATLTFKERANLDELGSEALWSDCDVPLILECSGNAVKFAASIISVLLVLLLPFVL